MVEQIKIEPEVYEDPGTKMYDDQLISCNTGLVKWESMVSFFIWFYQRYYCVLIS